MQNRPSKNIIYIIISLFLLFVLLTSSFFYRRDEIERKSLEDSNSVKIAINPEDKNIQIAIVLNLTGVSGLNELTSLSKDITLGVSEDFILKETKPYIENNQALNISSISNSMQTEDLFKGNKLDKTDVFYVNDGGIFDSPDKILPLLKELKLKNYIFLNASNQKQALFNEVAASIGYKILQNDIVLDRKISSENIDIQLDNLVKLAEKRGFAIAIGSTYPETIEQIKKCMSVFSKKGIRIVNLKELDSIYQQKRLYKY